jgi:hypothetical protein
MASALEYTSTISYAISVECKIGRMAGDLEVYRNNPRAVVARSRNLLVSIWRSDVEFADVKHTEEARNDITRDHSQYGTLVVAERGALRMSANARREASRIAQTGNAVSRGTALVIAVDGFAGAAMRAAVTAVQILSRGKAPTRNFDQVEPAARWIFEQLERDSAELDAFVAEVERLRAM